MKKKVILFFAGIFSLFNINCSNAGDTCSYNTVVQYEQGKILSFPDFKLEFTGERTNKVEADDKKSVLTYRIFDFNISNDTESKTISWSHGMGDIAPLDFEFAGVNYRLEMSNSESLNQRLKKNEIVIVKK